jgi:hypothetical protein
MHVQISSASRFWRSRLHAVARCNDNHSTDDEVAVRPGVKVREIKPYAAKQEFGHAPPASDRGIFQDDTAASEAADHRIMTFGYT